MSFTPPQVETWENVTRGRIVLLKYDRNGDVRREIVRGGQTFTLTPDERVLNSDRAANEKLDCFKNGALNAVRLLDDVDDPAYAEIASNPNMLGESDLKDMFKLHWKTFEKKLNDITNPLTISRLLQLANDDDLGVEVTMNKVKAIQARLEEVEPSATVEDVTVDQIGHIRGERAPQAVTPR